MDVLEALNDQQKRAAQISDGPLMVVAGPGTGKTKTLVHKIAYLISEENYAPKNILALTFTKKAAGEITGRLARMLGNQADLPFTGTFHSLGYQIVNEFFENNRPVSLISEEQRREIIKSVSKQLPAESPFKSFSAKDLSLVISNIKNHPPLFHNYEQRNLLESYNKALGENSLWDYDDLIIEAHKCLSANDDLRQKYQSLYKHILVDEFQDTSSLQYELVKLLVGAQKNIMVIGDPLQSIYSFRGANGDAFAEFEKNFPHCQKITLKTNYRSAVAIVQTSHQLFPDSPSLTAHNQMNGQIQQILTFNEFTEADWVVNKISQLMGGLEFNQMESIQESNEKNNFADFAVIYRTHDIARPLKKKFRRSGIPFQMVGGGSMYEQPEIQAIIACLSFLSLKDEKYLAPANKYLKTVTKEYLIGLAGQHTLSKLVDNIITDCKLREKLSTKPERLADLVEFYNTTFIFDNNPRGLEAFLSLLHELEKQEFFDYKADKVTLLTMHAAKGLEFKHVFLIGCEEGLIPFYRKNETPKLLEEKRLFYVGLTRAKDSVHLLWTKKRNGLQNRQPSSFLRLLRSDVLEEITDQAIAKIERRIRKRKEAERQLRLF